MVVDDRSLDQEYLDYMHAIDNNDYYTKLSEDELSKYDEMCIQPKAFSMEKAKRHPFLWAYYVIGIKPRAYQFKILNDMMVHQKVAAVTSRQIGKSTCAAIYAFWAAYANISPSGPQKQTKVLIVSHTEQAAKNLLKTIDDFMHMADLRWSQYTAGTRYHTKRYFHEHVKRQTIDEIEFASGRIMAYPPTDKVRGLSIDVLMVDEAAWLNTPDPEAFFNQGAMPTTTNTKGKTILFSTPKSTSGFYFKIVRPDFAAATEGWHRIVFPWTVVEVPSVRDEIWQKRKEYMAKGDEAEFKIEYECDFRSGKHSFFNPGIVDECVIDAYIQEPSWKTPVTFGLDFGDTHSRTVLTVVTNEKSTNKTRLLWYKEFPGGYNNADLPEFIDSLVKTGRFLPKTIVVDDCVGGKTAIELLRRRGYHLTMFGFKAQKEEYYEYMKVAFANRRVELFNDPIVLSQLKGLEAHELPSGRTAIRKPNGGRDDIPDSLMMACSPFIRPNAARKWRFSNMK